MIAKRTIWSPAGTVFDGDAGRPWGWSAADTFHLSSRFLDGRDTPVLHGSSVATPGRCGCAACTGHGDVSNLPQAKSVVPTDSIDWGSKLSSNHVTVYFANEGERFDGSASKGWSAYEQGRALAAMNTYASVSNLTFSVTTNADEATFKLVTVKSALYLGVFNPPGEPNAGIGKFAVNGQGWDNEGGLEQGGYGFITLVHELGHGFGMAHPHDGGGTSTKLLGVKGNPFTGYGYGDFDLNQGVYTTMSYNDGWQLHPDAKGGFPPGSPTDYGYQGGPMALDIAVIQDKYGANMEYHAGDDRYVLPDANDAGTFWSCIWDAGGTDKLVYGGDRACVIDLTAATLDYSPTGGGLISWADGIFGGYTIANGVVIEIAKGGSAGDIINGNAADNRLHGRAGADVLTGGAGVDTYYGGKGDDQFVLNSLDRAEADVIRDFGRDSDRIALDGDVYDLAEGVLGAGSFVIGTAARDANDRLVFDDATGRLFFDADGSGNGDQVLIATLRGDVTLAAADIIVI